MAMPFYSVAVNFSYPHNERLGSPGSSSVAREYNREYNTWHPRAARRNPRTVGDAGAAPVTIILTCPPRLACEKREAANACDT